MFCNKFLKNSTKLTFYAVKLQEKTAILLKTSHEKLSEHHKTP